MDRHTRLSTFCILTVPLKRCDFFVVLFFYLFCLDLGFLKRYMHMHTYIFCLNYLI